MLSYLGLMGYTAPGKRWRASRRTMIPPMRVGTPEAPTTAMDLGRNRKRRFVSWAAWSLTGVAAAEAVDVISTSSVGVW